MVRKESAELLVNGYLRESMDNLPGDILNLLFVIYFDVDGELEHLQELSLSPPQSYKICAIVKGQHNVVSLIICTWHGLICINFSLYKNVYNLKQGQISDIGTTDSSHRIQLMGATFEGRLNQSKD